MTEGGDMKESEPKVKEEKPEGEEAEEGTEDAASTDSQDDVGKKEDG